jgi:hypothetical protein
MKPIGMCDNELRLQRSPLQDPFNVPTPNSAALAVPSVEYINTQENMLTAKAAYETILASEVPLLLTHNQTTLQTAAILGPMVFHNVQRCNFLPEVCFLCSF